MRSRRRRITGKQHLTDEAKFLNRPAASWPVEYEDEVVTRGTTPVGRPCLRHVERSEGRPRLSEDRLADRLCPRSGGKAEGRGGGKGTTG